MKRFSINFLLIYLLAEIFYFGKLISYSNNFNKLNYYDQLLVGNYSKKKINGLKINNRNIIKIIETLKRSDKFNSPKKTIIDGKIKYTYRKSVYEPKKSIKEIEKLIENPINTKNYEVFIKKALLILLSNEIEIFIKDLKETDLSGQWIHKDKTLVINEKIFKEGTINFAYLLSHEIIHITQSCKGGGFDSYPVLLGLDLDKPKNYYHKYLDNSFYKDLKKTDIILEIEAYANQKKLSQTLNFFKYFCLK